MLPLMVSLDLSFFLMMEGELDMKMLSCKGLSLNYIETDVHVDLLTLISRKPTMSTQLHLGRHIAALLVCVHLWLMAVYLWLLDVLVLVCAVVLGSVCRSPDACCRLCYELC